MPDAAGHDFTPRGLSRSQSAHYVGISERKFDELVQDGRMPRPKRIDGRKIWDRFSLDRAIDDLPDDEPKNEWDGAG
jgi:predicted DNA-binding transcriptional regulator AlpA